MKVKIQKAVDDLLGIALAHGASHTGAQAAEAAAGLIACLARHPFSDVPETELWAIETGPDLCSHLEHNTILAYYGLVAKYESAVFSSRRHKISGQASLPIHRRREI
jgi:hypothetical protein